jgi:hypothetical protein
MKNIRYIIAVFIVYVAQFAIVLPAYAADTWTPPEARPYLKMIQRNKIAPCNVYVSSGGPAPMLHKLQRGLQSLQMNFHRIFGKILKALYLKIRNRT